MKGDFSRDTFDPSKHFSRVLMQQGRVLLDADWNEQTSILLHYLQTLAKDLIGPHGGPGDSFLIQALKDANNAPIPRDFAIGAGHYYVNGVLCDNTPDPPRDVSYLQQPHYPKLPELEKSKSYLVYLDVWERHITPIEDRSDDKVNIREVALGRADTATRAKVVWQVKVQKEVTACPDDLAWSDLVSQWQPVNRGKLKARAKADPTTDGEDPCTVEPDAQYRGVENQLYRVEIHRGGTAWDEQQNSKAKAATFKWSRENGSVVFPIVRANTYTVFADGLAEDQHFGLKVGDWVEFVDDDIALGDGPGPLFQVDAIDPLEGRIVLKAPDDQSDLKMPTYAQNESPESKHAILRRWDQRQGKSDNFSGGGVLITESSSVDGGWLRLEDGVQIQFQPVLGNESGNRHEYRSGDYWLVPARTATRDVEWPGSIGSPLDLEPHGVEHYYAPLAIIELTDTGNVSVSKECRRVFSGMAAVIEA